MLPDHRTRAAARAVALAVALLVIGAPLAVTAAEPTPSEPTASAATPAPAEPTADTQPTPTPTPAATSSPAPVRTTAPRAAAATTTPTAAAETPAPVVGADATPVDDAVLRWGVNHESNNRAFAPGTFNFLSAGRLPDPGRGGVTITESAWSQSAGDVSIEKWNGSVHRPATWAGLRTDSTGAEIPSPTSGRFSNHTVVLGGGTGAVDRSAGTASISWDGDFTVVYYSGMTFFYVSDPVLTVADGRGTLTATLSGFASSMDDVTQWEPVSPRRAMLADLGSVSLTDAEGFSATPAYAGVAVTGVDQIRTEAGWGSFPQSFIDFQKVAGAAPYWFTSGGSTDAYKPPLPVTVSYDASAVVDGPDPEVPTDGGGSGEDPVNEAPEPPTTPVTTPVAAPGALPMPFQTSLVPPAVEPPPADGDVVPAGLVSTQGEMVQTATALDVAPTGDGAAFWWWVGVAVLALAGACTAGTFAFTAAAGPRR